MGVYGSVWVLLDQTYYIWPKLYVLCWIGFIYFLAKSESNQHDWERVGLDQVNQVKLIKIFYLFYKRIQLRVHCYSGFHVKNQIFPFFLKKKLANTELVLNLGHYLNGSMNATLHYYSILPRRSGNEEKKGVSGIGLSNGRGGLWVGIWERELRWWNLGEEEPIVSPYAPPPSPIVVDTMRRNPSAITMLFLSRLIVTTMLILPRCWGWWWRGQEERRGRSRKRNPRKKVEV